MARRRSRLAWLALIALSCAAERAAAQGATGTWSGTLEGRGNYYWENSTRVVVPHVSADFETPSGVRFGAGYLIDVISSASIASGVTEDDVFTELRHGVDAHVGKEIDLDGAYLDLSARGTYSTEDDYQSRIFGLGSSLSWNERNTKLDFGVAGVSDAISANNDAAFDGELHGITLSGGLEQLLAPNLVLGLSYQLAALEGYLGNPYRSVQLEAAPQREAPPSTRLRHNGALQLKVFVPATETALHIRHRAYLDSWDLGALTPELRVYQHFGDSFLLRVEYRFYVQTAVYFIGGGGQYPRDHVGPTTNDPKLDAMQTHTLTFAAELRTDFLTDTIFDFAKGTFIDLQVSPWFSTSSFGDGVAASAGARLPF